MQAGPWHRSSNPPTAAQRACPQCGTLRMCRSTQSVTGSVCAGASAAVQRLAACATQRSCSVQAESTQQRRHSAFQRRPHLGALGRLSSVQSVVAVHMIGPLARLEWIGASAAAAARTAARAARSSRPSSSTSRPAYVMSRSRASGVCRCDLACRTHVLLPLVRRHTVSMPSSLTPRSLARCVVRQINYMLHCTHLHALAHTAALTHTHTHTHKHTHTHTHTHTQHSSR
jgi:hypothetical protein